MYKDGAGGNWKITVNGFVHVRNSVFRLPITEVQFIDKCSSFIRLFGVFRQARTKLMFAHS